MICIEAHCGDCNHICVKSPFFGKITKEERMNILLNDFKVIPKKDVEKYKVSNKDLEALIKEMERYMEG